METSSETTLLVERCTELLSARLTEGGADIASEDPVLLWAALHYLSVGVVVPPADAGVLRRAAEEGERETSEVLRVLPEVREAVRYRKFLGEWVRGEVTLDAPLQKRKGYQAGVSEILVAPTETAVAGTDEVDSPGWRYRIRQLLGLTARRRPSTSFTGTPGVVSYSDRDESPE